MKSKKMKVFVEYLLGNSTCDFVGIASGKDIDYFQSCGETESNRRFEFVALYNTIFVQIMRGYFNGCIIE